jgi:DNA-binding Lrp family transcriptional regulator
MLQGFGLPAEQVDLFLGEPMEFNSDEDKFEEVAMQFGVDADNYQVLRSKPVRFEADNSVMAEFMEVEPENKALDKKILAEIKRTKKVDADQISRRLDVPLEKVSERIEYLISKGRVTIENRIARIADTPDTKAEEAFEIRYKYDWRPEFKSNAASLETGSREFCKTLLRLNKLYTRQDIDQMTAIMGYSVWDRRGEWYTLPGTNISRPSCRHIWQQQIVVRKGNKIELV